MYEYYIRIRVGRFFYNLSYWLVLINSMLCVFNSIKVLYYRFNASQPKLAGSEINNNIFISITDFQKI
ncbi:hypothetical protein BH23THE1_BH23THE1_04360 [soil metagenome]